MKVPWSCDGVSIEFHKGSMEGPWSSIMFHKVPWRFYGASMEFHGVSMEFDKGSMELSWRFYVLLY